MSTSDCLTVAAARSKLACWRAAALAATAGILSCNVLTPHCLIEGGQACLLPALARKLPDEDRDSPLTTGNHAIDVSRATRAVELARFRFDGVPLALPLDCGLSAEQCLVSNQA